MRRRRWLAFATLGIAVLVAAALVLTRKGDAPQLTGPDTATQSTPPPGPVAAPATEGVGAAAAGSTETLASETARREVPAARLATIRGRCVDETADRHGCARGRRR
jgi:hypothetical protein